MNYANIFKRQTFLVVASVCAVIVILVGISYSLFQRKLEGDELVITTGSLKVTFNEGTKITEDLIPMEDEDSNDSASSYSFTIENEGTLDAGYSIQIYTDSSATGDLIPHDYVRVSLDGGTASALSGLTVLSGTEESDKVYELGRDSVNNKNAATGKTKTHTVRVWIDANAPDSVIGNVVALKLNVVSEVQE